MLFQSENQNFVIQANSQPCTVCGQSGSDIAVANFALSSGYAHTACLEKMICCEGCGKEYPAGEMIISYWHAFAWRCNVCESNMK